MVILISGRMHSFDIETDSQYFMDVLVSVDIRVRLILSFIELHILYTQY